MNTKIKLLIITLVFLLSYILVGCGNSSSKQQTAQDIQQEYPLKEIFNKIYAEAVEDYKRTAKDDAKPLGRYGLDTDAVHKMLQDSIVKNQLIYLKSQAYYDMILDRFFYDMNTTVAYINNNEGYDYSILLYTCYGDVRMDMPSTILTYNSETDVFDIESIVNGRIIDANNNINYNLNGWDVKYEKDEFGEDIPSTAKAYYSNNGFKIEISRSEDGSLQGLLSIYKQLNNEAGQYIAAVDEILIRDNQSGIIYNLPFETSYDDATYFYDFDGVHIVLNQQELMELINIIAPYSPTTHLITHLIDYTFSFKYNDLSASRSETPNLGNIRDAIDFLLNPKNFNQIQDVKSNNN